MITETKDKPKITEKEYQYIKSKIKTFVLNNKQQIFLSIPCNEIALLNNTLSKLNTSAWLKLKKDST